MSNKSDDDPPSLDDLVGRERDELSSWLLRERTADWNFTKDLWPYLKTQANWEHRNRLYNPPNDRSFALGSKQLQHHFDQYALKPVQSSSLEGPPKESSADRDDGLEALRNALLTRLLHNLRKKDKGGGIEEQTEGVTRRTRNQEKKNKEEKQTEEKQTSPRRATRKATTEASVTVFEQGANMYMNKSRKRKATDTVVVKKKLEMQLPSACAKELMKSNKDTSLLAEDSVPTNRQLEECTFLLSTNHSLLFYGYGSKRHVLDSLSKRLKRDGDVLSINGYDKDVTMEGILDILVNCFLDGKEPHVQELHPLRTTTSATRLSSTTPELVKRAVAIAQELAATRERPIFLALHNVDGLRQGMAAQEALAALVVSSTVKATGTRALRLLASVDNVNAPAQMWDVGLRADFASIWKEVHSFVPYYEEVRDGLDDNDFKKSKALSSSRSSSLRRTSSDHANLQQVLTSLAPRHAEALKLLASLQLDASSNGQEPVDYVSWRTECSKHMVTPNDSTLQLYLTELRDHGIVEKIVDQYAGTEQVVVPYSKETLHEIMGFEIQKDAV